MNETQTALAFNPHSHGFVTIIAGGRDYAVTAADEKWLDTLPISRVVSGCARGADAGGERWAEKRNLPVDRFPADWATYGKSAGFRRNCDMSLCADAVVLFPGGRGTAHMRAQAVKRGLVIYTREVGA